MTDKQNFEKDINVPSKQPDWRITLQSDHIKRLEEELKTKEQECEELKDKLNCCFCNPYVELNDIEKQRKCIEVTECFRQQLDQLKAENERLKQGIKHYQRGMFSIINTATECRNNKKWNYKE